MKGLEWHESELHITIFYFFVNYAFKDTALLYVSPHRCSVLLPESIFYSLPF